jgi:hypothetical protein
MKKAVWSGVIAAAGLFLFAASASAQAQTDSKSINVTVNVNARAKLTLGTNAITFGDQDPDTVPTLTSTPVSVDVKARTAANGSVTLTVIAGTDFENAAGDEIALNTLTWTATGTDFVPGASNRTTAQSVGTWVGSGNRSGSNTYSLPNSWAYAIGTYQVSLNYTLTAP